MKRQRAASTAWPASRAASTASRRTRCAPWRRRRCAKRTTATPSCERAQAVLGHPVEIVSGREEARLIFAGVARLQPSTVPRLVIDIGGRSTEMILGRGTRPRRAESFRVGSVSLSLKYFADGRFSERGFREAQIAAGAELEEALEPFAPRHWREALGSSGTVGAVSQVLAASGISDGRVTPGRPALADGAMPRGRQRRRALRCRA